MKKKYFLDTEFIEDGRTIDLISIALVCEDGREFYAESLDADLSKASEWVAENVVSHLWHRQKDKQEFNGWSRDGGYGGLWTRPEIASGVCRFLNPDVLPEFPKPRFWGYFADYDWVAFCQLFGTMMDLPKGMPMFCNDIKQLCDWFGNPELPKQGKDEHNALMDARWNKRAYGLLMDLTKDQQTP